MSDSVIKIHTYTSPVGALIIGDFQSKIIMIDWKFRRLRAAIDSRILQQTQGTFVEEKTDLHTESIQQLEDYFQQKRTDFNLPLHFIGTEFQKTVWNQLMHIPYGKTATYESLTVAFTSKESIRAVASANGANAISIVVPCHRVIGKNGELVGYAGGLPAKKKQIGRAHV